MKPLFLASVVVVALVSWYMLTPGEREVYKMPNTQTTQGTDSAAMVAQDAALARVTVSGVYVCLPLLGTTVPPSNECAYGLKTDEGIYYAVNYEAKAGYMDQFREGQRITATGYTTERAKLIPNRWVKFEAQGLFTITEKPVVAE